MTYSEFIGPIGFFENTTDLVIKLSPIILLIILIVSVINTSINTRKTKEELQDIKKILTDYINKEQ